MCRAPKIQAASAYSPKKPLALSAPIGQALGPLADLLVGDRVDSFGILNHYRRSAIMLF